MSLAEPCDPVFELKQIAVLAFASTPTRSAAARWDAITQNRKGILRVAWQGLLSCSRRPHPAAPHGSRIGVHGKVMLVHNPANIVQLFQTDSPLGVAPTLLFPNMS